MDRAAEHLNALNAVARLYLDSDPYRIVADFNAKRTAFVLTFRLLHPPPLRMAAIFGDLMHNLRSALDHIVYELALLDGGKPNRGRTTFPIYDKEPRGGFTGATVDALAGVGAEPRALIEALQPYNRSDRERDALIQIRRFNNLDKHRTVIQLAAGVPIATPRAIPFNLYAVRDVAFGGESKMMIGMLEDGAEILRAPLRVTGPNPKVEVQGEIPLDVALGEPPSLRLLAIPPTCGEVARVINRFRPFFDRLF